MEIEKFDNIEIYQFAFEVEKIGNIAVSKVLKENRELGIPIVFSINDRIYYELPDGEITSTSPFVENDDLRKRMEQKNKENKNKK